MTRSTTKYEESTMQYEEIEGFDIKKAAKEQNTVIVKEAPNRKDKALQVAKNIRRKIEEVSRQSA